jgi:hypothetical protein
VPLRWVLIRDPQEEEFRSQALLCTDLEAEPERIISWFVRRWQMEATFQEVRQRLGFETQTKAVVGVSDTEDRAGAAVGAVLSGYALCSPTNEARLGRRPPSVLVAQAPSDLLRCFGAGAQRELWANTTFCGSSRDAETVKVSRDFMERLTDAVCYAA